MRTLHFYGSSDDLFTCEDSSGRDTEEQCKLPQQGVVGELARDLERARVVAFLRTAVSVKDGDLAGQVLGLVCRELAGMIERGEHVPREGR